MSASQIKSKTNCKDIYFIPDSLKKIRIEDFKQGFTNITPNFTRFLTRLKYVRYICNFEMKFKEAISVVVLVQMIEYYLLNDQEVKFNEMINKIKICDQTQKIIDLYQKLKTLSKDKISDELYDSIRNNSLHPIKEAAIFLSDAMDNVETYFSESFNVKIHFLAINQNSELSQVKTKCFEKSLTNPYFEIILAMIGGQNTGIYQFQLKENYFTDPTIDTIIQYLVKEKSAELPPGYIDQPQQVQQVQEQPAKQQFVNQLQVQNQQAPKFREEAKNQPNKTQEINKVPQIQQQNFQDQQQFNSYLLPQTVQQLSDQKKQPIIEQQQQQQKEIQKQQQKPQLEEYKAPSTLIKQNQQSEEQKGQPNINLSGLNFNDILNLGQPKPGSEDGQNQKPIKSSPFDFDKEIFDKNDTVESLKKKIEKKKLELDSIKENLDEVMKKNKELRNKKEEFNKKERERLQKMGQIEEEFNFIKGLFPIQRWIPYTEQEKITTNDSNIYFKNQKAIIYQNQLFDPMKQILQKTFVIDLKALNQEDFFTIQKELDEELLAQNIIKDTRSEFLVKLEAYNYQITSNNILQISQIYQQSKMNLEQFISDKKNRENQAILFKIAYNVAAGIADLHSRNLYHCNIKPSNILVDESGKALIADFTSKLTFDPSFSAPELITNQKKTPFCDIYSLGCIIFYIFTGKVPYADVQNKMDIPKQPYLMTYFKTCISYQGIQVDPMVEEFIERCCQIDYTKRCSIKRLVELLEQQAFPEKFQFSIYPSKEVLNQGQEFVPQPNLNVKMLDQDKQPTMFNHEILKQQEILREQEKKFENQKIEFFSQYKQLIEEFQQMKQQKGEMEQQKKEIKESSQKL